MRTIETPPSDPALNSNSLFQSSRWRAFDAYFSPAHLAGHLDFQALICYLFRNDIDPLFPIPLRPPANPIFVQDPSGLEPLDAAFLATAAFAARQLSDVSPLRENPITLSSSAKATLFHERVHYWQFISCAALQMRFLFFLEELALAVKHHGGLADRVAHPSLNNERLPEEFKQSLLYLKWITDPRDIAQLDTHDELLFSHNDILATTLLLVKARHNESFFAAGADLQAKDRTGRLTNHRFVFDGMHLTESQAYIAQLLYEKKPLPHLETVDDHEDLRYSGTWEFWRRLHHNRYATDEELALSFLASVDLALNAEFFSTLVRSEQQGYVSNVSLRFKCIATESLNMKPLNWQTSSSASTVVARYQDDICRRLGWPSSVQTTKFVAVQLTSLLARWLLLPRIWGEPNLSGMRRVIGLFTLKRFYHLSPQKLVRRFSRVKAVWRMFRIISNDLAGDRRLLGQHILGTMLNACIYRIEHSGEFALPHLYARNIVRNFRLPLVMYRGDYLLDSAPDLSTGGRNSNTSGIEYPYPETLVSRDCIDLFTVAPLVRSTDGAKRCGFVLEGTACAYMKGGAGCPQKGLSAKEQEIRSDIGLDDWCHWTYATMYLGVAPPHVQEKWGKPNSTL